MGLSKFNGLALVCELQCTSSMRIKEQANHFAFYKIEHGMLGANWNQWTFETKFGVDQLNEYIQTIPSEHVIKVYAQNRYNLEWNKIKQFRVLKAVR